MKLKRFVLLLLTVLSLCAALAVPASAAGQYVYDGAGLLTATERTSLESAAAEVSQRYGCGVYSGDFLKRARNGRPVDIDAFHSVTENFKDSFGTGGMIFLIAGISLLIALLVCSRAKKNLKNVTKAADAEFFAAPHSLELRIATDTYTHTTETQVRIEDDSDRGGGGSRGGTSVNSSGFSHSSGKF